MTTTSKTERSQGVAALVLAIPATVVVMALTAATFGFVV